METYLFASSMTTIAQSRGQCSSGNAAYIIVEEPYRCLLRMSLSHLLALTLLLVTPFVEACDEQFPFEDPRLRFDDYYEFDRPIRKVGIIGAGVR
jgi:hypothetical protein